VAARSAGALASGGRARVARPSRALATALRKVAFGVLGIGVVVVVWLLAAAATEPVRVPPPSDVWEALQANFTEAESLAFVAFGSGGIVQNLGFTVTNVLIGVGIGGVIGIVVGVAIARFRLLQDLFEPPLLLLGTVPILVLLPFLSFWFGTGRLATNGLVIFYTFVMISVVAEQATRNVAGHFELYARSLGASQGRILREIVAPAIVPELIGALRVALAFGWGFQAVAEVLGGQEGIGRLLRVFAQSSSTAEMFAAIICLAIAAVIVDGLVAAIGRWLVRWKD
jgi:ABC-type nitrate/sulfonate/bicarbonate transport system permease component